MLFECHPRSSFLMEKEMQLVFVNRNGFPLTERAIKALSRLGVVPGTAFDLPAKFEVIKTTEWLATVADQYLKRVLGNKVVVKGNNIYFVSKDESKHKATLHSANELVSHLRRFGLTAKVISRDEVTSKVTLWANSNFDPELHWNNSQLEVRGSSGSVTLGLSEAHGSRHVVLKVGSGNAAIQTVVDIDSLIEAATKLQTML